jgi:hypothetical protein
MLLSGCKAEFIGIIVQFVDAEFRFVIPHAFFPLFCLPGAFFPPEPPYKSEHRRVLFLFERARCIRQKEWLV